MSESPSERGLDALARANDHPAAPYVKAVLGFALIAALPTLIDYSLFGFSLGALLSLKMLIIALVWAYTSQAWNILSGFVGQFSFGHAAYFGIGAYTTMVLVVDYQMNPWVTMLIGGTVAALYASIVGALTFRYNVTGHYFALTTLAFAELLRNVVVNMTELNGANGFYKPFVQDYASGYGVFAFQFREDINYFYMILAFVIVITIIAWLIRRSSIGLYFFAIRENENAAASLGIPVNRFKMYGILISAFFTAWGGTFWSMYFATVRPDTVFGLFRNVEILLPAIIGGLGTVAGPIVGAFLIIPLSEFLRGEFTDIHGLHRLVYGLALVLIVIYSPRGVVEWPERFRTLLARSLERLGVRERAESTEDSHDAD